MSKFLNAEGYFDKTGMEEIGTTSPVVVNGDVARALWLSMADQKQTDLLHFGPSHCCIGGASSGVSQFGDGATLKEGTMGFLVPPFADRVSFGILANGTGDLTLNGNYVISVANLLGAFTWHWGSLTENLVGITFANVGSPQYTNITYSKPAGMEIRSLVVRYNISSQALS